MRKVIGMIVVVVGLVLVYSWGRAPDTKRHHLEPLPGSAERWERAQEAERDDERAADATR